MIFQEKVLFPLKKIIKVSREEIYIIENKLNSIPNCYAFLKYLHLFNYKILC